jgi:uncharacterized protein (TIGR02145 family)
VTLTADTPYTLHVKNAEGCEATMSMDVAVAETFKHFSPSSDAAIGTKWTLIDERDNEVYQVVKMPDNRVWMAQNLNYQDGLTFNSSSSYANNSAFTATTNGAPAIGSFWCPGIHTSTTSTLGECDTWGALYTWEAAMSLDGKVSGSWSNAADTYTTSGNASAMTYNHGRATADGAVTSGRGICPSSWHVPTEAEWGLMLDAVEGSGSSHSSDGTSLGVVAGTKLKSSSSWNGTDDYGFSVLPAGFRAQDGQNFRFRGSESPFLSSSAANASLAWRRLFNANTPVSRGSVRRSYGCPVRCIRD